MKRKQFKIVVIDLFQQKMPETRCIKFAAYEFVITRHNIGSDFATAEKIIAMVDGEVDAIAFHGIYESSLVPLAALPKNTSHELNALVKKSRAYHGRELREFFCSWTLSRILRKYPTIFKERRVMFHLGMISSAYEILKKETEFISFADLWTLFGLPIKLTHGRKYPSLAQLVRPVLAMGSLRLKNLANPIVPLAQQHLGKAFQKWVKSCDVLVSHRDLLADLLPYDTLKGKVLIVDVLTPGQRAEFQAAGLAKVIELSPRISGLEEQGIIDDALVDAMLDLIRLEESPGSSFDEFVLQFVDRYSFSHKPLETFRKPVKKCAFVIHPLHTDNLYLANKLKWLRGAPQPVKESIASALAYTPGFYHGRIEGIRSIESGQEVICEIYALPATPKRMLRMDEQRVYRSLLAVAEDAKRRGCSLIGLGAYTKIVGDAGITVSKMSPIPVTNGNSYSAAATLWAAKEMALKLGFLQKPQAGMLVSGRAVIVGATGGIGRVSAFLLSLVFSELVLVGRKAEKLLELKEELEAERPGVRILARTNPDKELPDADLIILATSSQTGKVIDIQKVKPGIVICDCSRPYDISKDEALSRPDVLVIAAGEIDLPGNVSFSCDIDLPKPTVYACLAETALLTLEGRYEPFSLGRRLNHEQVKEIYRLGIKHGAKLSMVRGPLGIIQEEDIERCRQLANERLSMKKPMDKKKRVSL